MSIKGSCPLDEAQVRKAIIALYAMIEKKQSNVPKKQLVEDHETISCIITRFKIPNKEKIKPIPINIPHSIRDEHVEICLFVKDGDKTRIKQALEKDPVQGISKIMTAKKLRKEYSRFEDKRKLSETYDLFLADDRILEYLTASLGNKVFMKKKQPVAVRVSRANVSHPIKVAIQRTCMHINAGVCTNVKVAHSGMPIDHAVENVMAAMQHCSTFIPKGWNGIQSISLKTPDSIALPVFNSLIPVTKLPPVKAEKNINTTGKKRKLTVEDENDTKVKKTKNIKTMDNDAPNNEKKSKDSKSRENTTDKATKVPVNDSKKKAPETVEPKQKKTNASLAKKSKVDDSKVVKKTKKTDGKKVSGKENVVNKTKVEMSTAKVAKSKGRSIKKTAKTA